MYCEDSSTASHDSPELLNNLYPPNSRACVRSNQTAAQVLVAALFTTHSTILHRAPQEHSVTGSFTGFSGFLSKMWDGSGWRLSRWGWRGWAVYDCVYLCVCVRHWCDCLEDLIGCCFCNFFFYFSRSVMNGGERRICEVSGGLSPVWHTAVSVHQV